MRSYPGVYRRGQAWWIDYRDQFGRRHREPVGGNHQQAVRARAMRLAEIEAGKFGLRRSGKPPTLREFLDRHWKPDAIHLKPATLEGYEKLLRNHLLPAFGDLPLTAINRATVRRFIATKSREQRHSYSKQNPNPNRPFRAQKSIKNMVALLSALLESAASDYGLIESTPLRGILRRKYFPTDAHQSRDRRVRFLEPEQFRQAVLWLAERVPTVAEMVIVAALAGLRWGELVGLRVEEDIDFRRNKIRVSRALYRRVPQTPKTSRSVGDIDMCPTVRRIFQKIADARPTGWAFSSNDTPIGNGTWIKRQWRKAQVAVGVTRPISWHDLRHEFVCLLIAAGRHPKYIAKQARHHSAGFTLDRYGDLFETMPESHVEWWDDLLWPSEARTVLDTIWAQKNETRAEARVPSESQLVGEGGFEPPTSASRTLRAKPSCATPRGRHSTTRCIGQQHDPVTARAWAQPSAPARGLA